MRRLAQAGLTALLLTASLFIVGFSAQPVTAVPSTITFPVDAPKSVIESQSPETWCFTSQDNCHHDYNAADIFAPTGTPVVSPVSGTVIQVMIRSSGVGSTVQIRDADGDIWYLAHMHHSPGPAVAQDQQVERGTLIGYVGTSDHAQGTQPHLHIDMLPPPYTERPSCSAAACAVHPFVNLQPLLVSAYNSAPSAGLFATSPGGSGVYQWTGTGDVWVQVGGPAGRMYGGGAGLFATNPTTGDLYHYTGRGDEWERVGGPGHTFAVTSTGLFGLAVNGASVHQWIGPGDNWITIGGPAADIVGT